MASRNEITWCDHGIPLAVTAAQRQFFRLAEKHGFTRKVVQLETEIPAATLADWATGETKMPLAGFAAIIGIKDFPNELASVLIEATGKLVCDVGEDDADFHDMAIRAAEYLVLHLKAQHPDSPGKERICHTEKPDLKLAAGGVADRAGKAAA